MGFFSKRPRKGEIYTRAEALNFMQNNFKNEELRNLTFIPQDINGETCYKVVTKKEEREEIEKLKNERKNEFIKRIREVNVLNDYKPNTGFSSYSNYEKIDYDISR